MAQYKHDRFFKFYVQSLYRTKGEAIKDIQVRNDEDLEIDFMFVAQSDKFGWQQEHLGLFDCLMQKHRTIIVEHYSGYVQKKHINISVTRKNLYWEPKEAELIEAARTELNLAKSQRIPREIAARIEQQNPFTWILAVNCSRELLELSEAQPLLEYGKGVYKLAKILRMGIVVIEELEDNPEVMWLKMLGNKESARRAFRAIEQLSPDRREKNDTIKTSLKYCVYLKELPRESLTVEEQEFMRTMEQIDAWYEAEIDKAQQDGGLKQAQSLVLRQLNRRLGNSVSLEVEARVKALSLVRLDELGEALLDFTNVADLEIFLNS
jgi:Domain of unknown function (DUF4351)